MDLKNHFLTLSKSGILLLSLLYFIKIEKEVFLLWSQLNNITRLKISSINECPAEIASLINIQPSFRH